MTHTTSATALAILLTTACTRPYEWRPEALRAKAALDAQHARQIVEDCLRPDAEGRGGAYSAYAEGGALMQGVPRDARLQERSIEYLGQGPYADADDDIGPECHRASGALVPAKQRDHAPTVCRYAIDLDQLTNVVIQDCPETSVSGRRLPGYLVRVNQTLLMHMVINVPPSQLEPLLTALSFYAPNAKFLVGGGC